MGEVGERSFAYFSFPGERGEDQGRVAPPTDRARARGGASGDARARLDGRRRTSVLRRSDAATRYPSSRRPCSILARSDRDPAVRPSPTIPAKPSNDLRSSILARVPSNAQLTITVLRTAEAAGSPLPPPPLPLTPVSSPAPIPPPVPARSDSDTSLVSEISVASPKDKSGKKKLAAFVRSAARMTEEGAGYVSGQKSFDWEKVSRVRPPLPLPPSTTDERRSWRSTS